MDAGRRKESKWRHATFNMGLIRCTTWFYSMDLGQYYYYMVKLKASHTNAVDVTYLLRHLTLNVSTFGGRYQRYKYLWLFLCYNKHEFAKFQYR